MKTKREFFIEYLDRYGNDADTFWFSQDEVVLSFAGSDGPEITEEGFEGDDGKLIPFEDTKAIDEYLREGCKLNFSVLKESHVSKFPSITWTDYYKNYVLNKKNDILTSEFLEGSGFKKPGQTAGRTHWYFTTDDYEIVVSPGDSMVSVVNYVTGEQITFKNRQVRCTTDDLKKCLEFIKIQDPFIYDEKNN